MSTKEYQHRSSDDVGDTWGVGLGRMIGTPLPAPAADDQDNTAKDANKFVPVWQQEVTDERGRKRLHGAFTGGFSAGYFNTVGSKEGWIPQQFKSSRSDRKATTTHRKEDYMDEEDLLLITGGKQLKATGEFDMLGSTEKELRERQKVHEKLHGAGSLLAGGAMDMVLLPSKESIGYQLLRKMGWRQVQTEPSPVAKLLRQLDDLELEKKKKSLTAIEGTQKAVTETSKKGSGFGVGAFEEDDEDIYHTQGLDNYDLIMSSERDIYSMEKRRLEKEREAEKKPEKTYNDDRLCSDNRPPLKGFLLAQRSGGELDKWFKPPIVPNDFVVQNVSIQKPSEHLDLNEDKRRSLTAEERGRILGEVPLSGPSESVFSMISDADKSRIDAISRQIFEKTQGLDPDRHKLDSRVAQAALHGFIPFKENAGKQARYRQYLEFHAGIHTNEVNFPPEYTETAKEHEKDEFLKAARIFRPMASSMAARFTSAKKHEVIKGHDIGLTEHARMKEKAAEIRKEEAEKKAQEDENDVNKVIRDAVDSKQFGRLTRTEHLFFPTRLLCKRFSCPEPHGAKKGESGSGSRGSSGLDFSRLAAKNEHLFSKHSKAAHQILSQNTMNRLMMDHQQAKKLDQPIPEAREEVDHGQTVAMPVDVGASTEAPRLALKDFVGSSDLPSNQENEGETEEEILQAADIEAERPSMDIFKAIFSDSDDDSGSESNPEPTHVAAEQPKTAKPSGEYEATSYEQPKANLTGFRPTFVKKTDRIKASRNEANVSMDASPSSDDESIGPKVEDMVTVDEQRGNNDKIPIVSGKDIAVSPEAFTVEPLRHVESAKVLPISSDSSDSSDSSSSSMSSDERRRRRRKAKKKRKKKRAKREEKRRKKSRRSRDSGSDSDHSSHDDRDRERDRSRHRRKKHRDKEQDDRRHRRRRERKEEEEDRTRRQRDRRPKPHYETVVLQDDDGHIFEMPAKRPDDMKEREERYHQRDQRERHPVRPRAHYERDDREKNKDRRPRAIDFWE